MGKTSISWAKLGLESGESINPIRAHHTLTDGTDKVGHFCVKYGPGCVNCYASAFQTNPRNLSFGIGTGLEYIMSNRQKIKLTWDNKHATRPFRTSRPTGFFPCDMTDWLGWDWQLPQKWSYRLLAACAIAPWNRYFLLTKRYKFLAHLVQSDYNFLAFQEIGNLGLTDKQMEKVMPFKDGIFASRNIWLGVSICTQSDADHALPYLRQIRETFNTKGIKPIIGVSYEPCLEIVNWLPFVDLIDWLIPGGESDQYVNGVLVKGRPATIDMFANAIESCAFHVPIFVKQMGNRLAEQMGLKGKGSDPAEWPDWLQVQQFPTP